jgi:hypothetical protein
MTDLRGKVFQKVGIEIMNIRELAASYHSNSAGSSRGVRLQKLSSLAPVLGHAGVNGLAAKLVFCFRNAWEECQLTLCSTVSIIQIGRTI